jgi:hypothetical protein
MAQIFHRSTNTISRVSIYGAVFIAAQIVIIASDRIDRKERDICAIRENLKSRGPPKQTCGTRYRR